MTDPLSNAATRRVALWLLLGVLLGLAGAVLQMFLVPVAWAAILAFATWPLHTRLRRVLGHRPLPSAALMTLLITVALVVPLLWLLLAVQEELRGGYAAVSSWLTSGPHQVPPRLAGIPGVGEWLQRHLDAVSQDPDALRQQIGGWLQQQAGALLDALGGAGRNAAKLGFALITVLFLYRDGDALAAGARHLLQRLVGGRADHYLDAAAATTRGVVYGLVLSALAQGLLAGLGYWVAGLGAPVLLGVLTAVVALVPFGTPLAWAPLGTWLLVTGHVSAGTGLLLWGLFAVSWIDNLVRPLVISGTANAPFLLVLFGVIGGAAAFGLIGLFVGPVILAIALAVCREWLEEPAEAQDPAT